MKAAGQTVATVALLRERQHGRRARQQDAEPPSAGDACAVLRDEFGLLADEALQRAEAEIAAWEQRGIQVLSRGEDAYPTQLRAAHRPPPLLFVRGDVSLLQQPSVAVIGARKPTERGRRAAAGVTRCVIDSGFVAISGLAAGIDTAVHRAALEDPSGRTVAVIGTGLDHSYPAQNETLQRRIAAEGAVVSQFWPEAPPTRQSFPMRNAVMAGLAAATVIVEASERSGTRIQARMSLASGRKVLLLKALLDADWARGLVERSDAAVVGSAAELRGVLADQAPDQVPV